MCGICGIFNYKTAKPVEHGLIQSMTQTMMHRGPDDEGYYIKDSIGFGMRRLSIIDVKGGSQPIHNEDQTIWIVFNGEIYNYPELRKELKSKGHTFYTCTDTEVIVHAYEEWGDDCLLHLNGIFGLSIWDERKKRLLLARDPFGVKPLYCYDDGKRLLWGSEIKAVLADSSVPKLLDLHALNLFLIFRFVPSPFTMFQNIKKIPPGHSIIAENGKVQEKRYYFSFPHLDESLKEKDYVYLLQKNLESAVQRQMISDVPIGILLSGGIDSAVILAIMSKTASQPIRTFTVGFAEGNDVNELEEASLTAKHFGAEHHEVLLDSLNYKEWLQKSVWHLEEPNGTTSALPMYFVSRLARNHVKVVLTGQGADEPLCGYHRYYGERYGHWYRRIPKEIRNNVLQPLVETLPRLERIKRAVRSLGTHNISERFVQSYSVFNHEMRDSLWRESRTHTNHTGEEIVNYWRNGIEELEPLIQMTYIDARLSLADDLLMYGDKMSMAASVEARVPFLDLEYMSFAESLPAALRIQGITRKYIHKKAIAKWLPEHIIRRKKRDFETPMDRWFRTELTGYVRDTLLSKNSACRVYFRPEAIEKLIYDHVIGRQDNRRQLFCLLNFGLWHKVFIEK
jgi:asparagine synthase (glutamine-hydrolysing)